MLLYLKYLKQASLTIYHSFSYLKAWAGIS